MLIFKHKDFDGDELVVGNYVQHLTFKTYKKERETIKVHIVEFDRSKVEQLRDQLTKWLNDEQS